MKSFFVIVMLFFSMTAFSQTPSCTTLMQYVQNNGSNFSSLYSYTLNSSWLDEVNAYNIDGNIAVIASIKREGEYMSKKYVFCGISQSSWSSFTSSWGSDTYGERFNKYIMDSLCNCR